MPARTLVYDPTAAFVEQTEQAMAQLGRLLPTLSGTVVGFIDNSKPNFNNLVDELADALMQRCGVKAVLRRRKPLASTPASEAMMKELVGQCDLIITGSGD